MSEREDYIMRPVLRRLCLYESLHTGALDLLDVAVMNEALDVDSANRVVTAEWAAKHGAR